MIGKPTIEIAVRESVVQLVARLLQLKEEVRSVQVRSDVTSSLISFELRVKSLFNKVF